MEIPKFSLESETLYDRHLSVWELEGNVPRQRDDVYRTSMTLAFILSRSKLHIATEKLMENISVGEKRAMWIRIHHETPFFVKSEFLKTRAFIGSEISPETAAKVQRRLDGLLNFVHTELDGTNKFL